jgi:hypothetical protein
VEDAIATSDAVLIVIGADWLRVVDAAGGRRIDQEDDFVRLEVAVALSSGVPVVPVLVGGAVLPTHDELPVEMSEMLGRHAVTIRDTSWHQDVDDLARRLKGEERLAAPTRRLPIVIGVGVLLVLVVAVVATLVRNGENESSSDLPDCAQPDVGWTQVELAADPTDEIVNDDGPTVRFEVLRAALLADTADTARVLVQVKVTNTNESQPGDGDIFFYGSGDVDSLLVDGVQFNADCFGPTVGGEQSIEPDESAIAWTGFATTNVQRGTPLQIELDGDGIVEIGTAP